MSGIEALQGGIGRKERGSDRVTEELVRRFHATLGLPGTPGGEGEPAPRLIHWCLAKPAVVTAELGSDGHPKKGGFLPPVALPRRMWAGGDVQFFGDISVGDTVERVSCIADIKEKSGRTGLLYFVTVEHEISVDGAVRVIERQDIVYREAASGPSPAVGEAAASGTVSRSVDASPILLFRYSALTFNGHRIHYDRPYATGVEHYPGLVVHGPLQATLLYHFATAQQGRPPQHFAFRGQSPLADGPMRLHATPGDHTMKLWTAPPGGPLAMSAEANWND